MSPGVIRTIGILMFAGAFALIMIANNASYDKHSHLQGLALLRQLSVTLSQSYFYGEAPETLEELLYEDDRIDPWGKQLRYAPHSGTMLLWSSGPNERFEPLSSHKDDVLIFSDGIVESWTNESLIRMLNESDHSALGQILFLENDPELKRAAAHWAAGTGTKLDFDYEFR